LTKRMQHRDLNDKQWARVERLLHAAMAGGRPHRYPERRMVEAVRYVARTGCPWRRLPADFPPWKAVHEQFRRWRDTGVWEQVARRLGRSGRWASGRCAGFAPATGEGSAHSVGEQTVSAAGRLRAVAHVGGNGSPRRPCPRHAAEAGFVCGQNPKSCPVKRLLISIDCHCGNVAWDLKCICRELKLAVSASYVGQLFKRCNGQGVREYAKEKRLLMAAERLTASEIPIKVIAAEFGYRASGAFARRFKDSYHVSPTAYRQKAA